MNPTKHLRNTLITITLSAISAMSFAEPADRTPKTYTDPVSGELKIAPKLLSEMTESEKAALSPDEKRFLKEIEAQIQKEKKEKEK